MMEKWKEFIKGVYFGFLGVGLVIFILNDVYWSFKVPYHQVDFQRYYTILAGLVLVPFFIKVGADMEKTLKSK
ncbi:TPA: hypothetical protein U0J99_001012 [Streptococcus suis]|nr:hypothetical protein [Streptococcus suis]